MSSRKNRIDVYVLKLLYYDFQVVTFVRPQCPSKTSVYMIELWTTKISVAHEHFSDSAVGRLEGDLQHSPALYGHSRVKPCNLQSGFRTGSSVPFLR